MVKNKKNKKSKKNKKVERSESSILIGKGEILLGSRKPSAWVRSRGKKKKKVKKKKKIGEIYEAREKGIKSIDSQFGYSRLRYTRRISHIIEFNFLVASKSTIDVYYTFRHTNISIHTCIYIY